MSAPRRPRVLFVSYAFPPAGGVGVQRVTKFVKFLPQFGWDCSVLTVENPSVPMLDESLHRDIHPATIIRRARTLEPGYAMKQAVSASNASQGGGGSFKGWLKGALRKVGNTLLQPDPQILWRPAALKEGRRLLAEIPHHAIIATGPPFSSLLLGAKLARKSKLPLVLDYRDEWGISNAYWENKQQGRLAQQVQQLMQRRAVRAAQVLLATTPSSAAELERVALDAGAAARATYIYNGFDPDDFPGDASVPVVRADYGNGTERFRLAFIGTLWNLNPIGPFVDGVRQLAQTSPQLVSELELVFAGRRTGPQEAELDRLDGLPCRVVRLPFVSHQEACNLMRSADGLLLINADLPDTQRIINAKTFEYMAAKRPIFTVAPRGDLTALVESLPGSMVCEPSQPAQIADRLGLLLEAHRVGHDSHDGVWEISRFERRQQAGELAKLLSDLIGSQPAAVLNRSQEPGDGPRDGQPSREREEL
ncbi:MAG: glycosyltransferase [Planctomycetaceae bacterium]